MEAPKLYFNCPFVQQAGKMLAKVDTWEACCIPRVGIFFVDSKDDVDTRLFKHEMKHWMDGYNKPLQFLVMMGTQYATVGYKKAPLEVAARAYEKLPLTDEEQKIWDAA